MLLTAVLAWLHVICAIAWLGGGLMFGFVIAPALARLSPQASGEFFITVVPRVARFFQAFAGLTVLFGLALFYNIGGPSLLDPSTSYGVDLSAGMGLALIAFLLSEFVAVPPLLKAIGIIKGMKASGAHEPPAELARTIRMASVSASAAVVILLLASVFMVAAGFYQRSVRPTGAPRRGRRSPPTGPTEDYQLRKAWAACFRAAFV